MIFRALKHIPKPGGCPCQQRARARRIFLVFVLAGVGSLLSSPPGSAQTISGSGAHNCGAFNEALDRNSNEAIDSYISWSQGFISGVNVANNQNIDVAIDHLGLLDWLARYCASEPDSSLVDAVSELVGIRLR